MVALRKAEPVSASRFIEPDKLFAALDANVRSQPGFEVIVDIDHACLAQGLGLPLSECKLKTSVFWDDVV